MNKPPSCGSPFLMKGIKVSRKEASQRKNSNLFFKCMAFPRFGNPFVLYLERTVTWDVLQKEILEKMRHLLRPGVHIQVTHLRDF